MDSKNRCLVDDHLIAVRDSLGHFVIQVYESAYQSGDSLQQLQRRLPREEYYRSLELHAVDEAISRIDLSGWIAAILTNWDIFEGNRSRALYEDNIDLREFRSHIYELRRMRNRWAHPISLDRFTDEDVFRLADTVVRVLKAIKADIRVEEADSLGRDGITSKLHRVDLSSLNLSGMDLEGRNLHLANLEGANLSNSNLQYVRLAEMNLSNVKLSKSNLTGAKLCDSNLSHADLSETLLQYADLTKADFSYAKLEKANLLDAKMDDADFSYANLTGADMRISLPSGVETDAISVDLYDDLPLEFFRIKLDFSHATLREVKMQLAALESVNLTHADLTGADLTGSRLGDCKLNGAILNSANLSKCDILSCDFSGAKMNNVNLSEVGYCVHTLFRNAEMSGANLENFFIEEGNIEEEYHWDNVNLSGANLTGAILPRQSFRNANLTGAVFKRAYLSRADLSHADLMDTDFTGADLDCVNFTGAKFRYTTILPDGSYWNEDTDMTKFTGRL